jgi:small subunit ribosomal protein S9
VTPEERDDAANEPEENDTPAADADAPEPEAPAEEGEGAAPDEETAQEEDAPVEEPVAEAEEPAAEAEEPAAEADEPAAEAGEPAAEGDEPSAEAEEPAARERPRRAGAAEEGGAKEEVIPGAHLEPDLVLEEQQRPQSEYGEYGETEDSGDEAEGQPGAAEAEPVAHTPLDLAADARYAATGKRKRAVARVILRPGDGNYKVNKRDLDEYFPRVRLQRMARQPLDAAGYEGRMDVVARIHGGGTAAQATALRHGIARALVEADPALRGELKRRGYLTRDPRVKERKKAGLKKARKRPQFSKR